MTKAQNKRQLKQAINENFTVGTKFKAKELKPYSTIPTHIIGRYLAQLDNVRIVGEEVNRHKTRTRIYEVIN